MNPEEIIAEVSRLTGVTVAEIKSAVRRRREVYARTLAVHEIRSSCLGWSLQNIGDLFGTDHSNIAHSLRRHRDLIATDTTYRRNAETLSSNNTTN